MPFTEFACLPGVGSNLNAGTRTGDSTVPGAAADFTYDSGNWVAGTGVFTVASGNPLSDGVAVGDFASVYANGSTVTGFVGRVTARDATTITVSLTAKMGTAPTNGTGDRTLKIGGAWAGPSGADGFPFNTAQDTLTNASQNPTRINLKNTSEYAITAAMAAVVGSGFVRYQGFTTAYGDGGAAVVNGGTSGPAYVLFTAQGNNSLVDIEWKNNGASGEAALVSGGANCYFCTFRDSRGNGLAAGSVLVFGCLAYGCNQSNTAARYGFVNNGGVPIYSFCVSRDNTGSNTSGFSGAFFYRCRSYRNGSHGFALISGQYAEVAECDAWSNGGNGVHGLGNAITAIVRSCNLLKNTGTGVVDANSGAGSWTVLNCGFGSGSQANGATTSFAVRKMVLESGAVIYANGVTPWRDPDNNDFRIVLAAAKGAGYGVFPGAGGTVGYPDIGSAQSNAATGGGKFWPRRLR